MSTSDTIEAVACFTVGVIAVLLARLICRRIIRRRYKRRIAAMYEVWHDAE